MIIKIKRALLGIPMIPIAIVYAVVYPIFWVSEKMVGWCGWALYRYGFNVRKRFPGLVKNDS